MDLSAEYIYNRIRGLQPWPGAFTTFRGKNCQIWGKAAVAGQTFRPTPTELSARVQSVPVIRIPAGSAFGVQCGSAGALVLESCQLEGRNRITAQEFVNGAHLAPGERFGA